MGSQPDYIDDVLVDDHRHKRMIASHLDLAITFEYLQFVMIERAPAM